MVRLLSLKIECRNCELQAREMAASKPSRDWKIFVMISTGREVNIVMLCWRRTGRRAGERELCSRVVARCRLN